MYDVHVCMLDVQTAADVAPARSECGSHAVGRRKRERERGREARGRRGSGGGGGGSRPLAGR